MKRILLATTVIMPFTASMAFAQQFLNVEQTITATTQSATNAVTASSNSETLEQGATNVANLVDQALGGGTVDQTAIFLGQEATNTAFTNGRWRNVNQDSANLSNILQGAGFGNVDQTIFALGQSASNSLTTGSGGGVENDQIRRVGQSATNVGNLVNTESNTDDISQQVLFASQSAGNLAFSGVGSEGDVSAITQGASNLMNILSMRNASETVQSIAFSVQTASNEITQSGPGPFINNQQDATNVGNLIDGNRIPDGASQTVVALPQSASNVMNISGTGGVPTSGTGAVQNVERGEFLDQGATNLANIVQLAQLTADLTQFSTGGSQTALNEISRTSGAPTGLIRLSDVTQTATNATNLVSVDGVGGGSSLVQTTSTLAQTAGNSITGVSSVGTGGGPIIQGATNLGNVLTGND